MDRALLKWLGSALVSAVLKVEEVKWLDILPVLI
jgi:hypothetical protein